jgi:putative ABC transport system substrate-binding protein
MAAYRAASVCESTVGQLRKVGMAGVNRQSRDTNIAGHRGSRYASWRLWAATLAVLLVSGGLLGGGRAAQRDRPVRIGALTTSWGPTPMIVGLRDGLLKLGYREHEDFELGVRFTQGEVAALPAAARQLVQHGVDLIIADDDESARAAQQATSRIPIVFISVADPVGLGLVESFARPGGNITGVTDLELQLGPKRLQVFQSLIPDMKRVLVTYDATDVYGAKAVKSYRQAAQSLGIELVERGVRTQEEARAVLSQVRKDEVDGILGLPGPTLNINGYIMEFAAPAIPTMFSTLFFVERGGLAAYGQDFFESGRQAARLADRILKGAKPAELPVEMNAKIEFSINLKVAKALGLVIPPEVLYQADRLIR